MSISKIRSIAILILVVFSPLIQSEDFNDNSYWAPFKLALRELIETDMKFGENHIMEYLSQAVKSDKVICDAMNKVNFRKYIIKIMGRKASSKPNLERARTKRNVNRKTDVPWNMEFLGQFLRHFWCENVDLVVHLSDSHS